MIVKNEEDTLSTCLNSVKDIVDEIIIIDTGSTDLTIDIAKKYTDKIFHFDWIDDFSAARNYSFSKATKEYIMWLDADDVILDKDKYAILQLKKSLQSNIDTIIMKYDLTNRNTGSVVSSFYRERIVKRSKEFKWHDPVHEYILFSGSFVKVDISITHKKQKLPTKRNLEIFQKYIEAGHELSERNWFYYARELFNFGYFIKATTYYKKFLATTDGLHSNYLDCCIELSDCYRLQKDDESSLKALTNYFEKFPPRAEICCKLGYYYKNEHDYLKAISWFSLAPYTLKPNELGSYTPDCWDYIPYMELCSCYYKSGNIENAILYNEKAAKIRPDDPKICYNREYLGKMKNKLIGVSTNFN